jgi:hypothetical protein
MGETNSDGSLMAEISAQAQYAYGLHKREVGLEVLRTASFHRAIVDKQDIEYTRTRRDRLIKPTNKLCGRRPVVTERHKNYDM